MFILWRLVISNKSTIREKATIFFLPQYLFISLVILINYWIALLILVACQKIPEKDQPIMLIIASLSAPILSIWYKKRMRENT